MHYLTFTGVIFGFFHVHNFSFHGRKFMKIFTGKNRFSRALLQNFALFFTGSSRPKKNTASSRVEAENSRMNDDSSLVDEMSLNCCSSIVKALFKPCRENVCSDNVSLNSLISSRSQAKIGRTRANDRDAAPDL